MTRVPSHILYTEVIFPGSAGHGSSRVGGYPQAPSRDAAYEGSRFARHATDAKQTKPFLFLHAVYKRNNE